MVKLGVTGTRHRELITEQQRFSLQLHISDPHVEIVHHGDCTGWDEAAHAYAILHGKQVVIHPPLDDTFRAWCTGPEHQVLYMPEKPYLARNDDIVAAISKLVAGPAAPEVLRSGTWSTVRKARARGLTEENGRLVILNR